MSKGWKHSDLIMGEDLSLPKEIFETGDNVLKNNRIIYSRYIGETDTGIMVEVQFRPSFASEEPLSAWAVQYFISFASVYCGDVKIYRRDRTLVRAERIREIYRR